ncbi:MAG: hypothetical protein U9R53_11660, partial [Chloroflexota bacterium]|nr:hypothetical protein [Chloroflexota bacterium]
MKKPVLIVVIAVLVLGTIAGVVLISQKWHKPLGTSLELPTPTTTEEKLTATIMEIIADTEVANTPTPENNAPTLSPSPTEPQPLCGGPPIMYILGIGADNDFSDYNYGLA